MHSDKQLLDIFIEMQKEIKPTLSIEVGAFANAGTLSATTLCPFVWIRSA
jgi:hypothetical protein